MATLKRNHTPNVTMCKCDGCDHVASAPKDVRHRGCKKRGKWAAYKPEEKAA
jgi:hypothetical protein